MDAGFRNFSMRMKVKDHHFFRAVCQHRKTTMSKAIVGYINFLRKTHPKQRTLLDADSKYERELGNDGNLFKPPSVEQEPENGTSLPI